MYAHFNKWHTIRCDDGCTTESHSEKFDLFSQSFRLYIHLVGSMCAIFIIWTKMYVVFGWTVWAHTQWIVYTHYYRMIGVCACVCSYICYFGDDVNPFWQLKCQTGDGFFLSTLNTKNIIYLFIYFSEEFTTFKNYKCSLPFHFNSNECNPLLCVSWYKFGKLFFSMDCNVWILYMLDLEFIQPKKKLYYVNSMIDASNLDISTNFKIDFAFWSYRRLLAEHFFLCFLQTNYNF